MRWFPILLFLAISSTLSGCRIYNQNILFQTKENIINNRDTIASKLRKAETNYVIQPHDYIEVRLFTANGEALLNPMLPQDPNNPNQANGQNGMMGQNGGMGMMGQIGMQQGGQQQGGGMPGMGSGAIIGGGNPFPLEMPIFQVRHNGLMTLPVIGDVQLLNLTLHQADSVLKVKYNAEKLYQNCFVRTRYHNKRVTVFKGAMGFMFPLRNEKVTLLEVLASFGGMGNDLRGSNVRIIRGDLDNPSVYVINLRTMADLKASLDKMKPYHSLTLEPNDIIYVEPIRKTFWEAVNDVAQPVGAISGTIGTVLALIVLLQR